MANIYLIAFLALVSIRFFIIGFFQLKMGNIYFAPPLIYKPIFLFFIPCFYLYLEALFAENKAFNKNNLYHFILPLSCVLWNVIVANFYSEIPNWVKALNWTYAVSLILFYTSSMFLILRRKLWRIKHPYSVANYYILRNWTYFLFVTVVLLGFRVIVSLSYEWINNAPLSAGKYGFFIAAIVWTILLIKLLVSPEILHGVYHLRKRLHMHDQDVALFPTTWNTNKVEIKNEQDLKLMPKVNEKLEELILKVDNFAKGNRIFQNSNFSINDLADQFGIPKSHLVYLFKYHSNLTFSEYKTYQRILHAIELIHNGYLSSNTLESLAKLVGFASYNPFFTTFKKHTGFAPNEYVMNKTRFDGVE